MEGDDSDDGLRRISASARADLGGPGGAAALSELEDLALDGGEEAEAAAVARLILCMVPTRAPWNEEVAAIVEGGEFDRYVKALRTLTLSDSDPKAGLAMAHSLPAEAWAAEVRIRVAGVAEDDEALLEAAKEFLDFSPDGAGRILAARGLARGGDLERASEVCGSVARDPNTPAIVRSEGFHIFMKTLADRDAWITAERAWKEWRDFAFRELPTFDGRISAWQVRVLHNRRSPPST